MRSAWRVATALAAAVVVAPMAGCSSGTDPVDSVLRRQVDSAENVVLGLMTSPTETVQTPEELLARLSAVAEEWDGEQPSDYFNEVGGTPVFYDFRAEAETAVFDMFVASGVNEGSAPSRIYTCYRIEVSFQSDALWEFHRSHDYGEDRLECPSELVSQLGAGAQYRQPSMFDG